VAWAEAYLRTKWHLDPSSRLATIDRPKSGGCAPLGGAGSLSNTMSPGPSPISMPSFILIHPTVWRQYTSRASQDGTDRQTDRTTVRWHRANPFTNVPPKNGSPYAIGPLSCLSVMYVCLYVTLVYYSQMVGWIKIKLRTEVGHSRGHIGLDGDPAHPHPKGEHSPPPIFGACLLWRNGWMDQEATW